MSKRILVTSTDLMMAQFLIPHMLYLAQSGFDIEIACSDVGGRMEEIRQKLQGKVNGIHVVRLVRSPSSPSNLKGYRDMKRVISAGQYDIIWTNEPVKGVVTRLAARNVRKNGVKVLYMVHGFHFYKGAPLKLWCLFYPVEKKCAKYTDLLITINREDYLRSKKFKTKTKMIHGVGVDTTKFNAKISKKERDEVRAELGLKKDDFAIVYAAEFTANKNHRFVLESLKDLLLSNPNIKILFLGKGELLKQTKELANTLSISKQVYFLGYRNNIYRILQSCDLAVSASIREGLGLGVVEAQLCGLPIIISDNRGHREIFKNNKQISYDLKNPKEFAEKVEKAYLKEYDYHIPFDEAFSLRSSLTDMRKIYLDISK